MKIDSKRLSHLLYQLGVADTHLVHDENGRRIDAALSTVFARQLEYLQTEFESTIYPELVARDVIPVDYSVPSGATAYTYTRLEEIGEADFVKGDAKDYPNVEINGSQETATIVTIGDSYQYSIQELRQAAMAGVKIDAEKATVARKAIERKLDTVAMSGVVQAGLPGLLTYSGITPTVITGAWSNLATTGESIYNDVMKLYNAIDTASEGSFLPDTLIVPRLGAQIMKTRFMGVNDRRTVWKALQDEIGLKNVRAARSASTAGAGATPRLALYKYDKSVVRLTIPQEIEATEPQAVARKFVVYQDLRTGGVQWRNPLGAAYADNFL